MGGGLTGRLAHPRRSLGERHRTQSTRFLALADSDPSREADNLAWAEQHARQALLHDFTQEANWHHLAVLKVRLGDEVGLRALLTDLFAVLGRDPEQIGQLAQIDILAMGSELLTAAFIKDPLDTKAWWEIHHENLDTFSERFLRLDLTDPRCNVLFGRRLQQMKEKGLEADFIPLARRLLAQRPQNHEMWTELGRIHERREEYDEAWFSYDQAQQHAPHLEVREAFRSRVEARLDEGKKVAWKVPSVSDRDGFLSKMQDLAKRIKNEGEAPLTPPEKEEQEIDAEEVELKGLLAEREFQSAFFLARRLITRGESWAEPYLVQAQEGLSSQDEINIP